MTPSLKFTLRIAALACLGLPLVHCDEDTGTGPGDVDGKPVILKDSADSAKYFHGLYKGKWKPLKLIYVQPGVDTVDRTTEVEFHLYLDSTIVQEIPNQAPTIYDTSRYRVSRDSICTSTYGGNFLDWSCTNHAFKGKDTLDYSDGLNTEIWIRSN